MEDYARRGTSRRATSSSTPRTSPRTGCSTPPATCPTTPTACSRRMRGSTACELPPQADELPDAQPDLPLAGPLLPRAAAAAVRVRHGLPLREVRRHARADPGARHDPGRLAHLLHRRAGAGRDHARCWTFVLGLLRDYGLDDFYLELSTRRRNPDKFIGSDDEWEMATEVLAEVAAESGLELVPDPGGAAFYGPKISVQARDAIGRTWQMSTIQYDFNQPERFELEYQAADGTRQQPVMIHSAQVRLHRAVHRGAHRALRRRVPGLAVAGAGGRHPGDATSRSTTCTRSPTSCGRAASGSRWTTSDDRMQKKIRTAQKAEGAVHADRRRHGRRGRRGVVPLPRRRPSATASRSTQAVDEIVGLSSRAGRTRLAAARGLALVTRIAEPTSTSVAAFAGDPDALRPAVDPAPDGLHPGGGQAATASRRSARSARSPRCPTRTALIVARGELVYAVLNLYPYNSGHLMVVPVPARRRLHRPDRAEAAELAAFTQPAMRVLRAVGGAAGVQHRHEPGFGRRRRHRGAPAPARRAALGR